MIRYNEFTLSENLETVSKEVLLNEFLKNGLFLWRTSVLYDKKMDAVLKREIKENDNNMKTWYRFWLRTEVCIADAYKMYYLRSMIDKVFEQFDALDEHTIVQYIFDFNDAISARNNFSVFQTIGENVKYFRDESTPKGVVFLYTFRKELYNSIKSHFPKDLLVRGILEKVFGTYYSKCVKDIDYIDAMIEFIFREIEGDTFKLENIGNVVAFFLKNSAAKQTKAISEAIYKDMEAIYKTKVLKQKEATTGGKKKKEEKQ